jgi:hypothetical protein
MRFVLAPKHTEGIKEKLPQTHEIKNRATNTFENHKKWKTLQHKMGDNLTQKT